MRHWLVEFLRKKNGEYHHDEMIVHADTIDAAISTTRKYKCNKNIDIIHVTMIFDEGRA